MNRYLSIAVLSFAGLGLAAPLVGQAQTPIAVRVQTAPARVVYQPGYPCVAPRYIAPAPVVVAPRVAVPRRVYYSRHRVGYRSFRYGRAVHYRYHR